MSTGHFSALNFLTSIRNALFAMLGVLVVFLVLTVRFKIRQAETPEFGCVVVNFPGSRPNPANDYYSNRAARGKALFMNNCASCHNRNMRDNLTGPALGGLRDRWAAYPPEDLYRWIRNSQAMIEAGHPRAVELWATWKPNSMVSFGQLTDEEIEMLLAYIEESHVHYSGPVY